MHSTLLADLAATLLAAGDAHAGGHGAPLRFLQDLAVVLLIAGAVTVLFHRIRQPVVLGYLLAGMIIGPHTPPFPLISDAAGIAIMAELGMILLLFGLGLHFSLRQLLKVGAAAVLAAVLEIALMLWIGYQTGRAFGWSAMDSIFLGALLSVSSTTIIIKALEELRLVAEGFAKVVFGILIVEDILAIALIALLSGFGTTGSLAVGEVALTLGKLALFLVGVLVVGLLVVPRILAYVARLRSDEALLVATLGLCFGVALLADKVGYSIALGAFLIGAIMAETAHAPRIRVLIDPVRDLFAALFFVAIGMLIDPRLLAQHAWPIVAITAVVVVGKILACSTGAFLAGTPLRTAVKVGAAVSQIGEFSFIIASLGVSLKVTSDFLYPVAVSVSAVTTLLTPYLIRASDRLADGVLRLAPAPLRSGMDWYTRWVDNLRSSGDASAHARVRALMRRWVLQIALDLALIAGALIAAERLAGAVPVPWLPAWTGGGTTAWWLAAMLLALPLVVHIWYKQRALAMALAELAMPVRTGGTGRSDRLRAIVSLAFQTAAMSAVALLLIAISLSVLPPWPVLVALLVALGLVLALGWRRFVTVYYRAQVSVMEGLAGEPEAAQHAPLPLPIDDAVMIPMPLPAGLPAVGKAIRDLAVRTASGASIIAIERGGRRQVNPGPDEVLRADDVLLLFGTEEQVKKARALLLG